MDLLRDARYALRLLRRSPAFTLSTVLVLALGIGANAAIFSALDQAVIRPLPYADADRLAMLWEDFSAFGTPSVRVSPATFFDWRRRTQTFAGLAAIRLTSMNLAEAGAPEQVTGAAVTANLFQLMGVAPALGRELDSSEETPGHNVVILSDRLWRGRFGGQGDLLGRTITMSDQRYVVIAVMPAGFHFPDARTDFWIPIAIQPQQLTARNSHYLRVVGRLREGTSLEAARADMRRVAADLGREFPRTNDRVGVVVTPLREEITADARRALTLLLGAAACVLLLVCANVANLLLARASGRRREIAVRLALGARRTSIVRQLLTESAILAAAGATAGLLVARWSLGALARFVPAALSSSIVLHLDARAMLFAVAIAALTALTFGLAPAVQIAARTSADSLRQHGDAAVDRKSARLRRVLVVGEIALALVLVIGASLLAKAIARLRDLDPGFRADHVLTAEIPVPYPKYADPNRRRRFFSEVVARVRSLPGVVQAGLTSDLPFTSRGNTQSLNIENQQRAAELGQDALFRLVSSGYLQTIGAKLREGRLLDDTDDRDGAPPVVVVNEALARAYWPGETALGHRIDTGTGNGSPLWMTIVGVVDEVKERGIDFDPKPAVYVPFTQTTIGYFQPSEIAIRTAVPPESLVPTLRQTIASIDSEEPVSEIRTMDDVVDEELAGRREMLSLLGIFGIVALLLAGLGIYGVLSYLVNERAREIGIRIAIGASPGAVVRSFLAQSAGLAAAGITVGLATAFATTRWLGSLLYDVSPVDPTVLTGVSALLLGVALLASFVPSRRAAVCDPMAVLRAE